MEKPRKLVHVTSEPSAGIYHPLVRDTVLGNKSGYNILLDQAKLPAMYEELEKLLQLTEIQKKNY